MSVAKPTSRLSSPVACAARAVLMALAALSFAGGAAASDVPAPAGAVPASRPADTYLAQRGETLDAIIKKTMGDSPLRVELLRQAFVQANPHAFPGGKPGRLPPGVVLHLPDHVQLVRSTLIPLLQPGEAYLGGTASASSEERRRWVRFP